MRDRLVRSGWVLAGGALAWYVFDLAISAGQGRPPAEGLWSRDQLILLGLALVFALSTLRFELRWLQPLALLAVSPIVIMPDPGKVFGTGVLVLGIMILERCGFFIRKRLQRIILASAYLVGVEVAAILSGDFVTQVSGPTFFVFAFIVLLVFLYRERLTSIIRQSRPVVSLKESGLTPSESEYAISIVDGKSVKEIAIDFAVSESTVRTTISRACRKLGVADTTGLFVLSATHEIVAEHREVFRNGQQETGIRRIREPSHDSRSQLAFERSSALQSRNDLRLQTRKMRRSPGGTEKVNRLRESGLLFAAVFVLGYMHNCILLVGRGSSALEIILFPYNIVIAVFILFFVLSALYGSLRWVQPVVFLVGFGFSVMQSPDSISALGFFVVGVALLERGGFFGRHRARKTILLGALLVSAELYAVIYANESLLLALGPTLFILAFGAFFWFLYRERIVIVLREPKLRLSLSEKGLSPAESSYVRALMQGKSSKEIASDYDIAESTVRNTIARACKKLEVEDSTELAVMAATHEVLA